MKPIAQLEGIRKTYYKPDGSVMVEALRGIDLTFMPGEYVAIMGSSGSGKSTLMNVLGCLDRPTAGEYLLDGRDVAKMPDEELSGYRGRKIGFVFQAFNLIPELTIEENVSQPLFYQSVPKRDRIARATTRLGMVGLGDRLGHRPRELSGGQQQRVAIARAIVSDPKLLLCDEPTGDLDRTTADEILKMLQLLNRELGKTIVMVTHDPEAAKYASRTLHLDKGRFVEQGMAV
jgi:putative ABC transport system ATP-binding protein